MYNHIQRKGFPQYFYVSVLRDSDAETDRIDRLSRIALSWVVNNAKKKHYEAQINNSVNKQQKV